MRRIDSVLIQLAVFALIGSLSQAAEVLQLAPEQEKYSLSPSLDFLEDPTGKLDITDITKPDFEERFKSTGRGTPSFGMTRSAIWVRFTLVATASEPVQLPTEWLLEIGWPFLSKVEVFAASSGVFREVERMDPSSRLCVFRLPYDLQSPRTFYARAESDAAIILPMFLYTHTGHHSVMNRRVMCYGMYYGILLAIVLYNLLIYGSLKERIHIWFAACLIFTALYLAVCDPLTSTFLDMRLLGAGGHVRHVLLSGLMASFALFVRAFRKTENNAASPDKLLLIFVACAGFGLALTPVAPLQLLLQYDSMLGVAAPFVFVLPAISQWRRGFSPARFFLLGWLAIAILGFVDVLVIRGILPFTEWSLTALQLGAVVIALQFSYAVGYRIRLMREEREAALREREETFRALAENSIDMIMRFDSNCRHLYVNPIVEQETGIAPRAFIGKTHAELGFPQELAVLWERTIRKVFESRAPLRVEIQHPAGRWADWLLVPELDQERNVAAVLASARDITERKRAEEQQRLLEAQLGQAQKMESIGRLAGGVAHDFNNLLMAILGYSEMILKYGKELSGNVRDWLEQIQKAGERARDLTQQLLAFGRKQTLQIQNLDLNEVVVGFGKMLKRLIGEDIHVQTLLNPMIGAVKADATQMEQVLLNLAINARDAMPTGGRITIETANVVLDDTYDAADPYVLPGEYIALSISDTGYGMNAETQKKLFEPFFTTKDSGKATGLGLAMVYGIVKQHHGHITVYSEPGHGTTFRVYLPRVNEPAQDVAGSSAPPEPRGGSETILVVEDDAAVRELTRSILTDLGYSIIEAEGGRAAIRLAQQKDKIHLLLTDVIMPEMSGRHVYEEIAAIHPKIKAVYMSGYTADIIAHHGILDKGVHLLQKPFTRHSLAKKISEVLLG